MENLKKFLKEIILIAFLSFPVFSFAGNIVPPDSYSWNDVLGWIDLCLGSSDCSNQYAVQVGINYLSGFASSSVGYISFNCQDLNACSTSDYAVLKIPTTTSSTLYGFAWNDVIGWISFNCSDLNWCATSTYSVWIDSDGYFHGYAWNDIVGWISFNCQEPGFCGNVSYRVKTSFVAYSQEGILISSIFDTGQSYGVSYNSIIWEGEVNDGVVKFQLATATSTSGPWNFVGPNCDPNEFYVANSQNPIKVFPITCPDHYNKRYFRYKVILHPSQDFSKTPIVKRVIINYSP